MKKIHFCLIISLTSVMYSCKYVHEEYVEIHNDSSYTFEHWMSDSGNPVLLETIPPGGTYIHYEDHVSGKAKDNLGTAPSYHFYEPTDSIVISGGKTLIKSLYEGVNWDNEYVGNGNGKGLKLTFTFTDSNLQ